MTSFDERGLRITSLESFTSALAKAEAVGLLNSTQKAVLSETAQNYHSENGEIHLNHIMRQAISTSPSEFSELNYKDVLELGPEHAPRAAMVFLGIGIVAGFVWAMSD